MKNKCNLCNERLADWERELHNEWHRVHAPLPKQPGWGEAILWGLAFASPFIIMCILIAMVYR